MNVVRVDPFGLVIVSWLRSVENKVLWYDHSLRYIKKEGEKKEKKKDKKIENVK